MKRARRSRIVFAICAPIVGGCSLLTSFDGYTSTVDDAGGGRRDVNVDPTPDGVLEAEAPPPSSVDCTGASLCDDFERTAPTLGPWDKTFTRGGEVTLGTERVHAGSKSLHVALPATTDAGGIQATLLKAFASVSRVKSHYWLYLPSGTTRGRDVQQVRFTYGDHITVIVILAQGNFIVGEQQYAINGGLSGQNVLATRELVTDRWVSFDMDIDVAATPAALSLVIDGQTVLARTPLSLAYGAGAGMEVLAGVNFADIGEATTVDIDDVRIDVER